MRFETKVYNYTADEKVIGAEVTIYNEAGDKIKSIVITDETQLQELEEALEQIDNTYVQYNALNEILTNNDESNTINATRLNGHQGDTFVLREELANNNITAKPKSHSSTTTEYGPGTPTQYGHVKIRDDLNASTYVSGEALSSHQGQVLDNRVDLLEGSQLRNSLRIKVGRWNEGDGEDDPELRIVAGSGNGIYAKLYCDDPTFNKVGRNIFFIINGIPYIRTSEANGKTGKMNINLSAGDYPIIVFTRGSGDDVYPAVDMKVLRVVSS